MNTVVFSHQSAVMQESSQREAYEVVAAEFQALSAEQLLPVNVDIPDAIAAALGLSSTRARSPTRMTFTKWPPSPLTI
jgi:hypothetical protein